MRTPLISFAFVLAAASAAAQTPAPQTPAATTAGAQPPAAPQASVPATRPFTGDAGIMFSVIKPDKIADFEMVMGKVKEALGKSADPIRKQQALTWRVFKGVETGTGGNVVYVWLIDPPVKDADYTITAILTEAFPSEAQDLWAKYTACFVSGQTLLNLKLMTNMAPSAK